MMIYLLLAFVLTSFEVKAAYVCETSYDSMDIPHVTTDSLEGYYYCFGLLHGTDRAWEMDFFRRIAQGRNAEVLGFEHLKTDLMMRLLDLPSVAASQWKDFPEDKKKLLRIYSDGVNAGFELGKKAREFQDMGIEPEPWKPEDSLLMLFLQSFDQTRKTFTNDYEEQKNKDRLGEKASELFDEDGLPWENTILKEGEYKKKAEKISAKASPSFRGLKLWGSFPEVFGRESGSNNWVISRAKTKSGKAILANDPHLELKTPMLWYWINIKSPVQGGMGASLPGLPFIASGTNGKVAWGLTNSYANTADVVYVKNLKEQEIETIRPWVYVKLGFFRIPFFFKSFERLKSGHRLLPLETKSEGKVVLRWSGFHLKAQDILPMLDLIKVQSVDQMDAVIDSIGVPSWNFVFADTKGDIGYRTVGKIFKHESKLPYGMPEMTFEEFAKQDYLDSEEKPHVLRPKRNYVYTANNRHWPSDSAIYGGRGYSHSYRGFRIDELLTGKQDLESVKAIQCDVSVVDARFFLPKLQKYLGLPEFENWSMVAEDSSKTLPLYRRLMDLLFEKWEVNEYALFRMLDNLSPEKIQELKDIYGEALKDVKGRTWGEIHRLSFGHFSKNEAWKFSPEIAGPGDSHSVNPGTSKWNPDQKIYEHTSGASMRMIIEMGEVPEIHLALPGLNRNYDQKTTTSPWESWKNCTYSKLDF